MDALTDKFGNKLKVGDFVAYAALNYRHSALRVGEIVEVKELDRPFNNHTHGVRVRGGHDGVRRWFSNNDLILAPAND